MKKNKQALPLDKKVDVDKILQSLKVAKNRISVYCYADDTYYVDGTPQCIKNNEMFEEKHYVEVYLDPKILKSYQVAFHRCKIMNFVSLQNQHIEKRIFFSQCVFVENFEIINSSMGEIRIIQSRFKKNFYLSTSKCSEDVRVVRTHFEGNVDCHSSTFEKILDLRASEIIGILNFSGCAYKSKVDLLGFKPHIKYKILQEYVSNKQRQYRQEFEQNWEYKNFDFLPPLEMQDTFRALKDVLLKEGNALEAPNYHKAELYSKEIELDSKPKKTTREWIDWIQLFFYRQTSDHHTDLAKIFNNVIMLIALFGIFAFGLDSLATHNSSIPKPSQKFIFGMLSKTPNSVAFWSLGLLLGAGILTEIRNIAKTYLKGIFLSFLWRSIPSMVLLLILCVLVCESFALLPLCLQETILIFGVCSSFVGIYLFLLWRESRVWIAISYIVSLGILLFKPSLLLPFVGQLFDEGLKTNFPAMQSLSVVYCILMFLMLFSLQKTARKNSIIPS